VLTGRRFHAARVRAPDAEMASDLRSISHGHPWSVRPYCRLFRYDLEAAANWLIDLHNMIGDSGYGDKERKFAGDAVHVYLGAHRHLSRERVNEIRNRKERYKRLKEAKF
jgi:hypothetical protein